MFLNPKVLNRLMKQAFKGEGIRVARLPDEEIYIGSSRWGAKIKEAFIPNETLGQLVTLIRCMPEKGQIINVNKYETQYEIETLREMESDWQQELTITDLVLFGDGGTAQRLLQEEDTGIIYAINEIFIGLVSNHQIDRANGETEVEGPVRAMGAGVVWKNNACTLSVDLRFDEKNEPILKELKGVDIRPRMPE